MRVCIITKFFYPVVAGIENHCYNLAKQLIKRNIEVEIHTSKDTLTEKGVLPDFETIEGNVKVYRHSSFWRFIPRWNYHVIHLHNFNVLPHLLVFVYALLIRFLTRKSIPGIVVTLHGGFTPEWDGYPFLKRIYHRTLGKFFINKVVDRIIALNEWEKIQLYLEGIDLRKVTVIPNGVEDEAYVLPPIRANPELAKCRPYLLYIGRISREKNIHFVVKALKSLNRVNLIIAGPVGERRYFEYLKSLTKRLGLRDRVFFWGEVLSRRKYELIDNALAIVLVSHVESEGIVVKEAMARGKPIIVSNKGALPCIVKHLKNGFVLSKLRQEEFARAVKTLLDDREFIVAKMIKNNRDESTKWNWSILVNKILDVYANIISRRAKAND